MVDLFYIQTTRHQVPLIFLRYVMLKKALQWCPLLVEWRSSSLHSIQGFPWTASASFWFSPSLDVPYRLNPTWLTVWLKAPKCLRPSCHYSCVLFRFPPSALKRQYIAHICSWPNHSLHLHSKVFWIHYHTLPQTILWCRWFHIILWKRKIDLETWKRLGKNQTCSSERARKTLVFWLLNFIPFSLLNAWYPETWGEIHLEVTEKSTGCYKWKVKVTNHKINCRFK